MFTGPWKAGRGAGRARRGESVIIGSKKRVHVNLFGYPLPVVEIRAKSAHPTEIFVRFGVKVCLSGSQK